MDVLIRNVKYEDIPKVVDIQILGWQSAYKGIIDDTYLDNMDRESKIKKRREDWDKINFIVAEYEDNIVGFCRYSDIVDNSEKYHECDCELRAIYVKPEFKGLGIGKKMFTYAINDLKKREKNKMILCCLKDNFPSRKFYEKMGGKVIGLSLAEFGGKNYELIGFEYDLKNI